MEYNPYELIYMSRMGDSIALSALFAQYQPYFIFLRNLVVAKSRGYGGAEEEIILEMRIGLMDACERYREDRDASWRTFLTLVLKRRAANVLRRADNRDWLEHTIAFDAVVKEEDSPYDCFAQTDPFAEPEYYLQYHEARNRLERTVQKMNEEEKNYVYLWTKNTASSEASAQMNCTAKQWYKRMEKVQRKVKKSMKDAG